jgi:hypothetical protein
MTPSLVEVSELSLVSSDGFVEEGCEMRICGAGSEPSDFGQ